MGKPRIATVWLEGCAGCHMSLLDLDENLVAVLAAVDLTVSPLTDFKDYDFPETDLGIIEGAIGNAEHLKIVRRLREKCRYLMVWGDCAVFGGINSMRNPIPTELLLRKGYVEAAGVVGGVIPVDRELPELTPKILAPGEVVAVDCKVPGCPPSPDAIAFALREILAGREPKLPVDLIHFD